MTLLRLGIYLFRLLLFFIIPSLVFPMQAEPLPALPMPIDAALIPPQAERLLLRFDDILDLIEAIEDEEIEDGYTTEQIERRKKIHMLFGAIKNYDFR